MPNNVPQGYSEQRTSQPPTAPLYNRNPAGYDPATAAQVRSTLGIAPGELPPPSTVAIDTATLARKAGRRT
jgi:hypothetical protein